MSQRIEQIIAFHETHNFGTRENLRVRSKEVRRAYLALDAHEVHTLAAEATSRINRGNNHFECCLCCLACFLPHSLCSFHDQLVRARILYPGVIYWGADTSIAEQLIPLCDADEFREFALLALAWIGNQAVQHIFAKWRDAPPRWSSRLFVPPHRYADSAGWELTSNGKRRDLFTATTFPLVRPESTPTRYDAVQVYQPHKERCPWCGRQLMALVAIENAKSIFADHATDDPLKVLTCDICTCFGPVFAKGDGLGDVTWHDGNVKPGYLPPDVSEWGSSAESPLVLGGQSRHFLESADWSKIPGVSFSQIGGLPTWIQDADYPVCPECRQTMPFVGQISKEDFIENGEGNYYAFFCSQCRVSATCYQQT